ncbi:MAG: mechanosensitive ion channel [Nitrospiraceae bacterium]|nr:MAG: mechanosensitive ion channel [Nitrospiraceae bacterium]
MIHFIESLGISTSPLMIAIFTLMVFIIVAKIADIIVNTVIRKFARFTTSDIDDRIIDFLHRPVLYSIVIIGSVYAITYLGPSEKSYFYSRGVMYTLMSLIWCVALIRMSNALIEGALLKVSDVTGLSKDLIPLTESITKVVIVIVFLMVILSLWKISITPLMASAGIAGAAIAFASKDTIANLFGGLTVFLDKPYKTGDYIVLDSGERGEVVAIGMRSTRMKTRDDIMITLPNSVIANSKVINESAPEPRFRMKIPVSIAYGSDIELVQKTLLQISSDNKQVLSHPEPRVRFRAFGDSSLNFDLLCWAKEPALRGLTIHELNCAIYNSFKDLQIVIPFPQRDVHLHHD